ncbi:ATP-binding sensor histidine kinase [Microcoleus sp. FACHB-68]|uniref:trifunctional serine/threonine-protein kinase/ATP-binding protein/sensor histidine kinase n=1 Tax=Microcoleus sp. FACHB-68 TaxID=2692826 RepID=UPI0016822265|nr:ATP-binding sensor histidine kinase [Microcoleus sp. FACHB-68]MBD1938345.1 AAA family ATPase [Microcoleus sp. FACHB-68]
MNTSLTDYQLNDLPLHEGEKTIIFRGIKQLDKTPVIVKVLKAEYPTLEEITQLRHEYKISQSLNGEGIVRSIALDNYNNGVALILEDFGGESLKQFLSHEKINLTQFLLIAIQLSSALAVLHQNQIIHKDIKPHNIIINPETKKVKLTDFSISSRLSRETQNLSNPNLIEGTLAYMSPEQTGRMNRSIDYRTDFYSLGVTFYEMLTGSLPFPSTDPLELVHCHIAKQPVPPHAVETLDETPTFPEIFGAVSDIVIKLLAKNAEDRYQSAQGLKVDLEECLIHLQKAEQIKNFTPGKRDKSGKFYIPQKLYGREAEVITLMDAFDRVAGRQPSKKLKEGVGVLRSEMMLVSGYSGIGKSCLVQEVHKPILAARGYFIAGKFDQFKRNIPYAALIQAFAELIRQLLTESSDRIFIWKEKLENALGANGQVIVDVIPEVELIVGNQPAVPQMGPAESQNRFNRVFKQFIHVFTRKEHPLVLFLDDLQWADSASLKLIHLLIADPDSQYLLMIGAYRDNEVSPTHPLMLTLDEIKSGGAIVNNITLQPLALPHVQQLVADTLHEKERSKELAELVFNKTAGNPFFLTQLLQTLHAEKLLHFDFLEGRWLWNIDQIQAIGITDYNIVELVARNIQKLPEKTQYLLKLAACIGNSFSLDVLAIVNEQSVLTTADELWDALQAGLILPLSNAYKIPLFFDQTQQGALVFEEIRVSYKFLHDRVQQAAYSLIVEDQKKATHLKIGQLLLQKTAKFALEENIFDIVNQLNIGLELISNETEKEELANLNLIAGKKAKAAAAYEAAVRYLTVGLKLLPANSWQSHYDLALSLHLEAVEAEYLNINFTKAASLVAVAGEQVTSLLDKVKVYELQMQVYIAQLEMIKAVDTGLQVLESLGVYLLTLSSEDSLVVELPELAELENIPTMTDPQKLAAMRILKLLCTPVFQAKPEIFPQVILTMINLCIEHGNSALSAFAYGFYGLLLSGLGKLDAGYQAGLIALKLLEQFDAKELKAKVYNLFNANIRSWTEHAKNSVTSFQEGVQSGLETGDIEWGGYCIGNYCGYLFFTEKSLESAVRQQAPYIDLAIKIKQEIPIHFSSVWRQLGLNFQGKAADKYLLIGESFDEAQMLPRLIEAKTGTVLFVFYVAKTILLYQFRDFEAAIKSASLAAEQAGSAFGFMQVAVLNCYHSLALLAHYPQANPSEQQQFLEQVETNQKQMKIWAQHAPANFQHKYDLVEAEKARVLGKPLVAMEFYDICIKAARNQGYVQEEAMANELAAQFYFECEKEKIAQAYLTEAYYCYIRWGAVAKAKDLASRYPGFFARLLARETSNLEVTRTTTSTTGTVSAALDLAAVMKASLAISSEIVLDRLLEKLMHILIENAGARKGFLLLKEAEKLVVVAEKNVANHTCSVLHAIPVEAVENLPLSMINYIERTQKTVVVDAATTEGLFTTDPYIVKNQPKSILGLPILYQGKLTGILYLENDLTAGTFTPERLEVLKVLTSQVAISIENASLYKNLQAYSQELEVKNTALSEKTQELEQAFHKLQQTQSQLVQTEKISSLGQLVAGIAHEVNNPVSFITGNLHHVSNYVQDLINFLNLYHEKFPNPPAEVQEEAEAIELDYLIEDLPKILSSMQVGTERIREIMQSLRNFSRVDEQAKKPADIHQGIDSTLMILQHRLKANAERPAILLMKEYGEVPQIECYAGQLNQVFMNILANAIDALDESNRHRSYKEIEQNPNRIKIRTELSAGWLVIRISDNGPGMPEEVTQRLFDPFFTTKPVGKGTGLGLSISYQIVVEKHGGKLSCVSAPGEGTEFILEVPAVYSNDAG